MALEDAWRCVDDVAGTSVDTFCYMVERGDGLFYPSKVGGQFGSDMVDSGFWLVAFYRAWHNMKSLEERGLDPLRVIIDRCHEQGVGAATAYRASPPVASDSSDRHRTPLSANRWSSSPPSASPPTSGLKISASSSSVRPRTAR